MIPQHSTFCWISILMMFVYNSNARNITLLDVLQVNSDSGDSFGWRVSISGDTIVVGADGEDSNATGVNGDQNNNYASGSGAAYVFVREGTRWTQQAYLKASNTDASDSFGSSVSISGDTIVVGAELEGSNATGVNGDQSNKYASWAGAAYVFVRNGDEWTQQAYLKASNTNKDDTFGRSVSISGDTIVVGAPGEDSNATGVNGDETDNSASSSGAVYVFVRNGTTWTQQAYLKASNTGVSLFGYSVDIEGDTIVVGARDEDSNATGVNGDQNNNYAQNSGAVYVFVRNENEWTQQAYLKASNTGADNHFGYSVSISGDTIVVGADQEESNATGVNGDQDNDESKFSGAAYVFVREGTTWTQQAYLKASNTGANDFFGRQVSISGDTIVIGADQEDSNATGVNGDQNNNDAQNSGAAYVFVRNESTWTQVAYLKADKVEKNGYFGGAVAVGKYLVVGQFGGNAVTVFDGVKDAEDISTTAGTTEISLTGTSTASTASSSHHGTTSDEDAAVDGASFILPTCMLCVLVFIVAIL